MLAGRPSSILPGSTARGNARAAPVSTDPRPIALSLRGLAKHYRVGLSSRRRVVLSGIDLELAAGARLGLVGPNGSGKSTLLRIAAGAELQSSGSIAVLDGPARSVLAMARVGFVPDGAPFPRHARAPRFLRLCASLQGLRGRAGREASERMLERVGLADARGRLGTFSRGMLRRLALAQAFVHDPRLVLLDEPTSGLDAEGYLVLDGLLGEARARGTAIVLASHLVDDVARWTDEVAVLVGGKLTRGALLGRDLGAQRLEVEGLDGAALAELERWIEARGGRVTARGPTTSALVALYRAREPAP